MLYSNRKLSYDEGEVKCFTATAEDFKRLNEDMREEDKEECRVFGCEGDDGKYWDVAYTVEIGGDLVGIIGFNSFADTSSLSKLRMMIFLTTNSVWKHKKKFVECSRRVARWVMNEVLPHWVDTVYSFPMSSYRGSIEWQRRILGFKVDGEVKFYGVRHTRMKLRKGEMK